MENGQEEQPALPDMELINIIEGMHPEERMQLKRSALDKISECESLCRMVDDAFAGEGLESPTIIY